MTTIETHLRKRLVDDYGYRSDDYYLVKYVGGSDVGLAISVPVAGRGSDKATLEFSVFSDLNNRVQVEVGIDTGFRAALPLTREVGGMAGRPTYWMCGDPELVFFPSMSRYMTLADVGEYLAEWMPKVEACVHVDYIIESLKLDQTKMEFGSAAPWDHHVLIADELIRGWGPRGEHYLKVYDDLLREFPNAAGGRKVSVEAVRAFAEKHPDGIERPYYSDQRVLARRQLLASAKEFHDRLTEYSYEDVRPWLRPAEPAEPVVNVPVSLGHEFLEAFWYDYEPERTEQMLSVFDEKCDGRSEFDSRSFGEFVALAAASAFVGFFLPHGQVEEGHDLTRDIDLRTVGLGEKEPLFHDLHPGLSSGEEFLEKYAAWIDSWVEQEVSNPLCLMEFQSYDDCYQAIIVPVENIDRLQALIADYEHIVLTPVNQRGQS